MPTIMADSTPRIDRVLLHLKGSRHLAVDPDDVYYLEAAGNDTIVRKHGRRTLRDVRTMSQVLAEFEPHHFHRIHDKWAVNLRRIHEIRLHRDGRDWEVVLRPPVNRVLPVSRSRLQGLLRRFARNTLPKRG